MLAVITAIKVIFKNKLSTFLNIRLQNKATTTTAVKPTEYEPYKTYSKPKWGMTRLAIVSGTSPWIRAVQVVKEYKPLKRQ